MLTPHEEMRVRERLARGQSPKRILLDYPEGVALSDIEAVDARLKFKRDLAAACVAKMSKPAEPVEVIEPKQPAWFVALPADVAGVVEECCRQQGIELIDFMAHYKTDARRQAIYVLRVRWGFLIEQVADWFGLSCDAVSTGQKAWAVNVVRKGKKQFARLDPPFPKLGPAFRKGAGKLLTALAGEYGVTERAILYSSQGKGDIRDARKRLAYALMIEKKWEREAIGDLMQCSPVCVYRLALAHAEEKGLLSEFNGEKQGKAKRAA